MAPLFTGSKFGFFQSGLNYNFIPGDSYFSNVSLLLHMENESGIDSFIDYSINQLSVDSTTTVGINTAQSRFGSSSAFFSGSSSSLATASSSLFDITGDFTIECWVYPTSYSSSNNVLFNVWGSASNKLVVATLGTGGSLAYLVNGSLIINTGVAPTLNAWSHIALVKSGNTTTLYLNGTSLGTTTTAPSSGNKLFEIGTDRGGAYYIGYIDELRVTKGIARYTSTFQVPTSQFQGLIYPVIRTDKYSLLQNQTSTISFNFLEAPIGFDLGDTTVYGGTLSSLTSVNSTRYTAVFTPTSVVPYDTASITVNPNTYFDRFGQSNKSAYISFSVNDTGVDSNFSNVSLLLHMNGDNGGTTFVDNSSAALTITPGGNVKTSSTQSKFSGSSAYFNGVNNFLSVPISSGGFNFGFGNFTIEAWIYLDNVLGNKSIVGSWPFDNGASWRFVVSNDTLSLGVSTPQGIFSVTSSSCLTANTWYHVAAVRSGNTYTLYCNGISVGTVNNSSAVKDSTYNLSIGRNEAGNTWYLKGYIDEIRITKGVARYTSNFAPPTTPFPN